MKTIFSIKPLQVTLKQSDNGLFCVIYGKQIADNLPYERAAHEMGECIMHSLQCENLLDETHDLAALTAEFNQHNLH